MSQRFLDPDAMTTRGLWSARGPLPQAVRTFGRYPDLALWQPGDLVLVSAIRPGCIARRIIAAQERGGFAPEDARWHHAAVYVGDGRICEATLRGVRTNDLYAYIGTHRIRVRRDPQLTPDDGYRIALAAFGRLRWYYSSWTLVRMLLQSLRGFYAEPVGLRFTASHSIICSMLYADAYSLVTRRVLGNTAGETTTPAFLSSTALLEDVAVGWARICG
jgi:hypothetical protein